MFQLILLISIIIKYRFFFNRMFVVVVAEVTI